MSNIIQENIKNSYLFGCVKYKNEFSFYLMPIAYWILNHLTYDPEYNPDDWEFVFRGNILNVNDNNIDPFIKYIEVDKIDIDSVNMSDYRFMDIFLFFIDFDSKIFISYFDEIDIEEYLPDDQWIGKFEDPINYLSENLIKKVFPNYIKGSKRSII
ncbi:hypothetical protein [Flavobacterium sp.]|uniref:hypothetical protein n=1 Tax=Flavobacterium sp. TaxID=239 RepID=UPI0031E46AF7